MSRAHILFSTYMISLTKSTQKQNMHLHWYFSGTSHNGIFMLWKMIHDIKSTFIVPCELNVIKWIFLHQYAIRQDFNNALNSIRQPFSVCYLNRKEWQRIGEHLKLNYSISYNLSMWRAWQNTKIHPLISKYMRFNKQIIFFVVVALAPTFHTRENDISL